jgi:tripeptidyl-peptidase I
MRVQTLAVTALLLVAAAVADVRVQLHLKRSVAEEAIEREFQARTTPGSAKYQQHMSAAELRELVAGTPEAVAAAERFLSGQAGVKNQKTFATRDVVSAVVERTSPVAAALGLTAGMFEASQLRRSVEVPAALRDVVERITVVPPAPAKGQRRPKAHYPAKAKAGGPLPFPGTAQTPGSIKTRYNVPAYDVPATAVQGVGEFQQSYFKSSWMSTFSERYGLPVPDIKIKGPNAPSSDDIEGTLDLEYITGIAQGATTWWISSNDTGPDPFNIDFAWWCEEASNLSPMPTVVSLSWGIGENNYVGNYGVLIADNDAFRKLGLLGVTVFAASGDTGPGSRGYNSCTRFDPGWPATSPYLTAVGATYALSASDAETSVSFSGGGFSDVFPTPSWQQAAVTKYLTTAANLPAATFYNASGRGFPDVAALGTNFMVYGEDQYGQEGWMPVSGTSCASPTFAAVITRVNALRVASGKATLGFLNPTIYQLGKVGNDVTNGTSEDPDCYGFDYKGFPTAAGWDAVSGLGTPDFAYLASQFAPNAPTPTSGPAPTYPPPAPTAAPTPAPSGAGGSFVQKQCTNSTCASGCQSNTLPQNECLKLDGGGSAKAVCTSSALQMTVYPTSTDCTGFSEVSEQPINQCVPDESGTYLENICSNGAAAARSAAKLRRASLKQ